MEIIDCHIHPVQTLLPWEFGEDSELAASIELTREAMDCVGVDRALLTPGSKTSEKYIQYAISHYPDRFVGAIGTSYKAPDFVDTIKRYKSEPGVLAIGTSIINWWDSMLTDDFQSGAMEPFFEAAEEVDIPMAIYASNQADSVASIAKAHPNLQIIVNHTGIPQPPSMKVDWDKPWETLSSLNSLAQFPNVAIKFSAAHTLTREGFPHHDVWPYLHQMIEAFTPGRLLWGSDMTRLRMAKGTIDRGPRDQWVSSYADALYYLRDTDEISASDKEQIFGGTLRKILRWPK